MEGVGDLVGFPDSPAPTTARDLKNHGGLVRYLRREAERSGLSYHAVMGRWYRGRRGHLLTADRRELRKRRPAADPTLPLSDMYVRTWFGSFNVSRPEGMRPWPASLARRALEGCNTTGPGLPDDLDDLEPPGWD